VSATVLLLFVLGTISPGGGGSIMTPAWTRFSSGVPLFGPKPLKFYPAVGFYLGAKSIHNGGGGVDGADGADARLNDYGA